MSLSTRNTADLVRIASAGGGFVLDASVRPVEDLVRIAAAGSMKGAQLVFTGLEKRPTDDLVRIAAAGKGCVQFAS